MGWLASRQRSLLGSVAEAAIPPSATLAGADERTVAGMSAYLEAMPEPARGVYRGALMALDAWALGSRRRPFSALPLAERQELLRGWETSRSYTRRALLRVVLTPLKLLHFEREEMFSHVGCRFRWPEVRDEQPRWLSQVTDGRDVAEDMTLECEVVVVGTGAGGAAVAYELARRGRAVLLLEEGDYHRRSSFSGRTSEAYRRLYRDQGLTVALGNVGIPLWVGRTVGGTTTINSGTCYRAPERTLAYWRDKHGLPREFSSEGLSSYYREAEQMLGVAPAEPLHVGKIGEIIARGAEARGLRHGVLHRNAPDCDGQGVCCLGCPTGAKRSTDVSYVPAALMNNAQLVTGARVTQVDVVAGRARGVTVALRSGRRLRVDAEAVVVAAGSLLTPLLLQRSGACLSSGMLGKNLSLHPATKVMALFDERVDMSRAIPQGYAIDHYADEGLMFEGGSLPLDLAALSIPWTGPRFSELIERYPYLATFGFMIQDHSRGSVRAGPGGKPVITYNLSLRDLELMQRGVVELSAVFREAGARRVMPMVAGHDETTTVAELERLRTARLRPGDIEVTAFHPLGTCRLGTDPARSCIGPDHEAHDVAGLYVCDGSAIPSSLGVNPQMTIMALSLRAAAIIDSRLS